MKNKFTKKHKNVLIIKGTQGMASLSLAVVYGVKSTFDFAKRHCIGSAPRARKLSLFGVFLHVFDSTNIRQRHSAQPSSAPRARKLSLIVQNVMISVLVGGTVLPLATAFIPSNPVTDFVRLTPPSASAAPSDTLNFQGRLLTNTGGLVPDGDYHIEFKLYDALTSSGSSQGSCAGDSNCLWTETRTTGNLVTISNGYYSVYLGDVTALPSIDWSQELYLGMNIGGSSGSASWDGEMTPRFKMTAVPYAFRAANVASGDTNAVSTDTADVSVTTGDALGATSDSGDLTVDVGSATGTAGTVSIGATNASALTLGNTGAAFTLQGSETSTIVIDDGSFSTTLDFTTPTADRTITFPDSTGEVLLDTVLTTQGDLLYHDGVSTTRLALGGANTCFRSDGTDAAWGSCSGTGDILQNGNSFGTTVTIGSNDAQSLVLEVGGVSAVTIADEGATTFQNETNSASAFAVNNQAGSPLFVIDTSNSQIELEVDTVLAAGQSLILTGSGTLPGSPTEGEVYYDSTSDEVLIYNGTSWEQLNGNSSSTYVVAQGSSTSPAVQSARQEMADYIADGANDEATIESAITAANAAGGGTVYLMEGTYLIETPIDLEDDVSLVGAGQGKTTLFIPNGTDNATLDIINIVGDDNVYIAHMTINGNQAGQAINNSDGIHVGSTSVNPVIEYVTVVNNGVNGVYFSSGDGEKVINSRISSNLSRGVYLASSRAHVENNVLNYNGNGSSDAGIYIASGGNIVTGNSLFGTDAGSTGAAINVTQDTNNIVSNNLIEATASGPDIFIAGDSVSVTGNTIENGADHAIETESTASNVTITGNNIVDAGGTAIYNEGVLNTIADNVIDVPQNDGIYSTGNTNIITGNTIDTPVDMGIFITTADRNIITDNIVYNTGDHSLFVDGSSFTTIANNVFRVHSATGFSGVFIEDDSHSNTITDNQFSNVGSTGSNANLEIEGDFNQVAGNYFTDDAGTSDYILIDGTANKTYLSNNTFDLTGTYTEEVDDNGTNTVYANQVDGSDNIQIQAAGTANILLQSDTDITGNLTTTGTIDVGTLGATDNASFLCQNSGGLIAGCNFTPLNSSLTDNIADALDIQEGTNNYINIATTDGSENISFGNATTNPSYNFLGSGTLTTAGALAVQGTTSTFGVDDTTAGIVQVYGAATTVDTGGGLQLNFSADHDGTYEGFEIEAFEDDLQFVTGPWTRLTVKGDTGNVGIGVPNPGAKLEVDTDDGDNAIAFIVDQDDVTNNNAALVVENAGTGNSIEVDGTDFIVSSTGNVTSAGTYTLNTLGSTDNASFVCRNSSNILAGCNYTPLNPTLTDDTTDALDIQEGTNNYININTTNSSENISFGNATTNPTFNFLGTGTVTVAGDLAVNDGDITSSSATASLFNTTPTTINVGTGAATAINLGLSANSLLTVNDNLTVAGDTITLSDAGFANCTALETSSGVITCGTDAGGTEFTFVVAASDSDSADAADYTADGTDDDVQIQAALDALPAGGGTVYLMEGNFEISSDIIVDTNDKLIGAGSDVTNITIDNAHSADIDFIDNVGTDSNIELRGFTLNGNGTNVTITNHNAIDISADEVLISDVKVIDFEDDGIELTGDYNTIENSYADCYDYSTAAIGLHVAGSYSRIVDSFATRCGENIVTDTGSGNLIDGNTATEQNFNNNSVGSISVGADSVVSNNTVINGIGPGIYLATDSVASGNYVSGSTMGIITGANSSVTGNTIEGSTTHGIYNVVTGATITGNTVTDSTQHGLYAGGGLGTISGNTFDNNTGNGIYVISGSNFTITGNSFVNNDGYGVQTFNSSYNVISDNRFYQNGDAVGEHQLYIHGTATRTRIVDNYFTDNNATTGDYIHLFAGSNIYLSGNTFNTVGTYDLEISDGATDTIYASQITALDVLRNDASEFTSTRTVTLTGTVDVTASSDTVTANGGTGTAFDTELEVGDRITANGETHTIEAIASATSLTTTTTWAATASNQAATKEAAPLRVKDDAGNVDFVVSEDGSIYLPNLTSCDTIDTDADGLLSCGTDDNTAASITLQDAYNQDADGSDAIIALTTADDSLIVRNPASGGTDSIFVMQVENLETGNTDNNFAVYDINGAGSFDTTAGDLTNYGIDLDVTATESAGGNTLTNVGLAVDVSGGDTNYAALFNGGNVGIGTTTPDVLLTIDAGGYSAPTGGYSSDTLAVLRPATASSAALTIQANSSDDSIIYFGDQNNEDQGAIEYDHGSDSLRFYVNDQFSGLDEALRINSNSTNILGGEAFPTTGTTNLDLAVVPRNIASLPALDASTRVLFADNSSTSTEVYQSFIVGTAAQTGINFGDSDDENEGYILYDNNGDTLTVGTAATTALTINSSQLATFSGALTANGNVTLGDADTDTLEITGGTGVIDFSAAYFDTCTALETVGGILTCGTDDGDAAVWTTDANVVNLVADGDTVTVGSATNLAKLAVDGDADEVQLLVQANGTQGSDIFVVEHSGGGDILSVGSNGAVLSATAATGADEQVLSVAGTLTDPTNAQEGVHIDISYSPTASSTADPNALEVILYSADADVSTSSILTGISSDVYYEGAGDADNLIGVAASATLASTAATNNLTGIFVQNRHFGTGTADNSYGLNVQDVISTGTVDNNYGIHVAALSRGDVQNVGLWVEEASTGDNTNLLLGTGSVPSGSFSIYNASSDDNIFNGNLRIGSTTAPTVALDVTGAALVSSTLGVTGLATFDGNLRIADTGTDNYITIAVEGDEPADYTLSVPTEISGADFFCLENAGNCVGLANSNEFTAVVGRDNSLNSSVAEYTADGTSDEDQINSAIDAVAGAGGGTVLLLEGTYVIDGTIDIDTNVQIVGSGRGATVIQLAASTGATSLFSEDSDPSNWGIRDLSIDVNGTNNAGDKYAIRLDNSGSGTINNIEIYDFDDANDTAIYATNGAYNLTVTDSHFYDGSYAIWLEDQPANVSQDSIIANNGFTDIDTDAVYLWDVRDVILENNNFEMAGSAVGHAAITLEDAVRNITITGNTITSTGTNGSGIYADDVEENNAEAITISNNTFRDLGGRGLFGNFPYSSIVGNSFANVGTAGAFGVIEYGGDHSTISGNSITDTSGSGITIDDSFNASVGNTITGNSISYAVRNGIEIMNGSGDHDNNVISNNNISFSGSHGIVINSAHNNIISGNKVVGDTTAGTEDGISITGNADNNQVIGNSLIDTTGTGSAIDIASTANETYLADNTYSGSSWDDINDAASDTIYATQLDSSGNLDIQAAAGIISLLDNTDITGTLDVSGQGTFDLDLAVNGGDLTTTAGTASLFNTNATTLNIGGAATTLEVGAATGTTSINNSLTVDGNVTLGNADTDTLEITGGTGVIDFSAAYFDTCTALETVGGILTCGTDDGGSATTLQDAYDAGNIITTADADGDIDFILFDDAGDRNFDIDIQADNTVSISRLDNASTEAPAQLLLVENLDTNLTIADGILITDAGGVLTDGLDVSDSDITNAINIGANAIAGTNFSVTGAGAVTAVGVNAGSGLIQGIGGLAVTNGNFQLTGGGTFQLDSSAFDVSTAGVLSGITGYTQDSGNFSISGVGTFGTGTGAVSLNGATSVTGTNTFTVGTGTTTLGGALDVTGLATFDGNLRIADTGSDHYITIAVEGDEPADYTLSVPTEIAGADFFCLESAGNCLGVANSNEFTAVVAASDSLNSSVAEYTADGTSDEDEINSAISAVNAAGGGKVLLLEGTYVIDGTIELLADVEIIGSGKQATIIQLDGSLTSDTNAFSETTDPDDWAIKDLSIDINAATTTSGNYRGVSITGTGTATASGGVIDNVEFYDFDGGTDYGVYIDEANNVTVKDSVFSDGTFGIYVAPAASAIDTHHSFEGNLMSDLDDDGIVIDSGNQHVTIVNNRIENGAGSSTRGVDLDNADYAQLRGNTFANINGFGFYITNNSDYLTITDNTVENSDSQGLYINGSDYMTITGNTFENNGTGSVPGVGLDNADNVTFTGNTISGSSDDGLRISSSNSTISGNMIFNSGDHGISSENGIDSVIIDGNTIQTSGGNGIELESGSDISNTVSNNSIDTSTENGISLSSADNNVIEGNALRDNTLHAILLVNADENTVNDNTIFSNDDAGIVLSTTSLRNVISDNNITDNGEYGIYISASGGNVITGNSIYNNGGTSAWDGIHITGDSNLNQLVSNQIRDTAGTGNAIEIASGTADKTYLADNVFDGTGASSIADSGTDTIFATQLDSLTGNLDLQAAGGTIELLDNTNVTGTLTTTSTITVDTNAAIDAVVALDSGNGTAAYSQLQFLDNGTSIWQLHKNDSNDFQLWDDQTNESRFLFADGGDSDISSINNIDLNIDSDNDSGGELRVFSGGTEVFTVENSGDVAFGENADHTISVDARSTAADGRALTVAAGAGGSSGTTAGGILYLNGGAAGSGGDNGGNVVLSGGAGDGAGVQGLVMADTFALEAAGIQDCTSSCTITQGNVDSFGSILITTDGAGYTITLPDPTLGEFANGRIIYITNADPTYDFVLSANGGTETINLKPNTTATMIWHWNSVEGNGDWTAAGASSSTDLQAAYDNTAATAGGAEIVLSSSGTGGLTVRNDATTPIVGGLLEVQSAIGSNVFSVNSNATEFASNGGAETAGASASTFPASTWDATTGGTVSRYTTAGDNIATGEASVSVVTTSTNHGARNTLQSALTSGLTYTTSFAVRGSVNFSTLEVLYSPDGTTSGTTSCASTQTVTNGQWTRISCNFVASGSIDANNAILIRQTDATGRTFYIENLSVQINASATYAADGSVDDSVNFATNWTDFDGGAGSTTVTEETSIIFDTSASAEAATTANANQGIRNNLAVDPQEDTQYLVSFYARTDVTITDNLEVGFLPAGGTTVDAACTDYNTQTLTADTWTKVTCLFTTSATTITNPDVVIYQADASARSIFIDALSITLNTNNSNNVQIGGGNIGGPVTLFTLDRSAGNPIADNNDAYLGSMYYDTTTGRIQCYEADGWGACGAAPDNVVNLNPEYAGAVLNGSGVGTMTADFCAEQTSVLNVNTDLCDTGEAKNFYQWTSPQATEQEYSIYVTYQLPETFNGFASDDTVQLVGRVDDINNATVSYEMFKSTGTAITACGTETDVAGNGSGSADTWYSVGIDGNEATGCSFNSSSAGNFIIFKINMKADSNANAFVSTLSFTTTGR